MYMHIYVHTYICTYVCTYAFPLFTYALVHYSFPLCGYKWCRATYTDRSIRSIECPNWMGVLPERSVRLHTCLQSTHMGIPRIGRQFSTLT